MYNIRGNESVISRSIIQLKNNLPVDFTLLTVERVLVNTNKMLTLWAEIF